MIHQKKTLNFVQKRLLFPEHYLRYKRPGEKKEHCFTNVVHFMSFYA